MGRTPCCSKVGLHRGVWSVKEDSLLVNYIQTHGEGHWRDVPKKAGLLRCGKSCRLRWMNYLRPDIKRGNITSDEEDLIIRLHSLLGNRWSLIAKRLPGRTDNEIKNHWNSHLSKRIEGNPKTVKQQQQKRNTQHSKHKNNKKLERANDEEEEKTKPKIYLPKAIRVSPKSITRNSNLGVNKDSLVNIASASSCWSDLGEASKEPSVSEERCSLVNTCNTSLLDFVPEEDNYSMFDEIFEEYQQLLSDGQQLDSFVDSLLL